MSEAWLLTIYCALVLLASLAGGWFLLFIRLTHTRLQLAVSFVAGLMLGIALLHFLPDADVQLRSLDETVAWMLGGFLAIFFIQRFFHFHHHDLPEGEPEEHAEHRTNPAQTPQEFSKAPEPRTPEIELPKLPKASSGFTPP